MRFTCSIFLVIWSNTIAYSQFITPNSFRDYLVLSFQLENPQNNKTYNYSPNIRKELYFNIITEWNKQKNEELIDSKLAKKIILEAGKKKENIHQAMAFYTVGWHYTFEKEDSLAYEYLTKAEKIFIKNKDTTGMIFTYRALRMSVFENFPELAKKYLNKLLQLSQVSRNPIDKYHYYLTILGADSFLDKQPSESQMQEAFEKAIKIIDSYPYLETFRRSIYRAFADGYVRLNKSEKVLDINLKIVNHPKITTTFVDYQNLGRAYIRVKKFDDAIIALEKARQGIVTLAPNNYRRQRNIYRLLKMAFYGIGNLKESIKADEEFDKVNEKIHEIDRSLAMVHLKEKYSFTEKEAELKRIALEKQVIQSQNELLQAQFEAKKRETNLKTLALMNQSVENKAKVLGLKMKMLKKENDINVASTQKNLLIGGLLTTFIFICFILFFSIRLRNNNIQLKSLQVGRDKFYTIIAHDLRSSVNSLSDLGRVLNYAIKKDDKEQIEKVLQQVEYTGQHAQLLLTNMFEWGKNQYFTNNTIEQLEKLDVIPLLEDLLRYYRPYAMARDIDLIIILPSQLWLTTAPKGFVLATRNLLDNAFKHTSSGDKITLCIQHKYRQRGIELYISDTGTGIDLEQLTHLQEVFAGKVKPEIGVNGLGLGTLLIHNFVRNVKAIVQLTSDVGVGTRFAIFFNASN